MHTFQSSGNIKKSEGWPDKYASNYQFSSVTLNDLAMKTRESIL